MKTDIGLIIKQLRDEKNLKQNELAEALGLKVSAISNYENGVSSPSYTILLDFANYFGVETDYLLGRKKEKSEVAEKKKDPNTIILYPYQANAGQVHEYSQKWVNKSSIKEYVLPGLVKPNSVAFMIEGDSMTPNFGNGSIIVCEKAEYIDLPRSAAAVLVCREAVYFKQILPVVGSSEIELKSINSEESPPFPILRDDVREIYKPYLHIRRIKP
jgi:transcriptional regulator with XRE-family HTH domain